MCYVNDVLVASHTPQKFMERLMIFFCDNSDIIINTTKPECTLKRKHTSIEYHRCREAQATDYEGGHANKLS